MKIQAKIKYWEEYIPPRCRKPRYREVNEVVNVSIKEVNSSEAPIAMITTTYKSRMVEGKERTEFGLTDTIYRWYKNKLYTPCISQSGNDSGKQYTISDVMYRINATGYPCNATKQDRVKDVRYSARRYLIIDDVLYEKSGEPRYNITTFGLGHNHGGTGFFVATGYNSNISKNNYFNALQRNEAIKQFEKIALGRGDTDSVKDEYHINIKVLIPEAVKCKPQKEHGEGCAFMNTIESFINTSETTGEAAIKTVAYTLASIN